MTTNIQKLKFQLEEERSQFEREKLRYEKSVRDNEKATKDQLKRLEDLESDHLFLYKKYQQVSDSLNETRKQYSEFIANSDTTLKEERSKNEALEKERNDLRDMNDQLRGELARCNAEREAKVAGLASENRKLKEQSDQLSKEIELKQKQIIALEDETGQLKSTVFSLKTNGSDESFAHVQKELSHQVELNTTLQYKLDKCEVDIRNLASCKTLCDTLQEEKHTLQEKIKLLESVKEENSSLRLENLVLNDEKRKWALFLAENTTFKSPEELVKLLAEERTAKMSHLKTIGELEAQIAVLDNANYKNLCASQKQEMEALKIQLKAADEYSKSLENNIKLKEQEITLLKEFNDATTNGKVDTKSVNSEYKEENARLTLLLKNRQDEITELRTPTKKRKTMAIEDNSPQAVPSVANLRKMRQLEYENDKLTSEMAVLRKQIKELEDSHQLRDRILELKDNPTSRNDAVKQEMLQALKAENDDLLAKLKGSTLPQLDAVPISVLNAKQMQNDGLIRQVEEEKKRIERLKHVFTKRVAEFKDAIVDILGYDVELIGHGKLKAISQNKDELIFTQDSNGKFVKLTSYSPGVDINIIKFWVEERRSIPCFLSAINLEIHDQKSLM